MSSALQEKELNTQFFAGEDDVRQYLSEIRRYPRLSPEEERDLAKRCAAGDEAAIRQMVNSNLRLVVSVAREYAGRGVPMLDLIQEGSIGLLAAAKKFDYTLEYRFSTYATKWIRQGVTRCLFNHGALIRVPVHTAERIRKIEQARTALLQASGEEPTMAQIAACCDIPEEKVISLIQRNPEICSLDAPMGNDDGTLGILLEDVLSRKPYEELVHEELVQAMESLMAALNERQRQVLRLHYGMDDGVCHSLEEIGGMLGVSKERARQIEKQAMEKLQKLGADMGLEEFLNE
ncbi:MAG: sigma-70 family RNA polymerase sigma factor [Oscillospiraceae bacterium]|nr:sigma-70 family RNA polymerase sigma factor [Oscillospiraceae bacterium]